MATYYWVGGAGTWDTTTATNWSVNSGSTGGAGVPTATDDVIIDANSGFTTTLTISVSGATPLFVNSIRISPVATSGSATISITGTLGTNTLIVAASAGNRRIRFVSSTQGTSANLIVVNRSSSQISDLDFRDIKVTGSYTPLSGIRLGDCGSNTGVSFDKPKTVYFIGASTLQASTSWSATSGGTANTDYFPLPQDTAIIDNNSGNTMTVNSNMTYIGTLDSTARTTAFTISIANMSFSVYGDYKIGTGVSHSASSSSFTLSFEGRNKTQNIRSNGRTLTGGYFRVFAIDSTVNLEDPLSITNGLTFSAGTFNTNNYNITTGTNSGYLDFQGTPGFKKVINFGYSTIVLTSVVGLITNTTAYLLTLNASNSTINCTGVSSSAVAIEFGGFTWGTVNFQANRTVTNIQGLAQVTNLSFAQSVAGTNIVTLDSDLLVTGTLTTTSTNATTRTFISSSVLSTTRTITAAAVSLSDTDFRDITTTGAATWSGTRLGNCGGNSNITFEIIFTASCSSTTLSTTGSPALVVGMNIYAGASNLGIITGGSGNTWTVSIGGTYPSQTMTTAGKTVYWNLAGAQNWSAVGWCIASGGTPAINNFPLAQDTAVFDNTGSVTGTITINATWNVGTVDMSTRTTGMTLSNANTFNIYGNWKNGTGTIHSLSSGTLSFAGRSKSQVITSNGVAFTNNITVSVFGGSLTFADSFSIINATNTPTFTITAGTLNIGSNNFTYYSINATGSTVIINMGSGTWTSWAQNSGNVIYAASGAIYNKQTANISWYWNSSSTGFASSFTGGGNTFNKVTMLISSPPATPTYSISDCYLTELAGTGGNYTVSTGTNVIIGTWSLSGSSAGALITVTGSSFTLLNRTSGINYLTMGTLALTTRSTGEFYAGTGSTGTGTGIILTAAPTARTLYWVGGNGTWDGSTTTNWTLTSGVSSPVAPPTSVDTVIFNSASNATAYTVTISATTARCASLTIDGPTSGVVTFIGSTNLAINGNLSIVGGTAKVTNSFTGGIIFGGNTTGLTINFNGVSASSTIEFINLNSSWSLTSALSTTGTVTITGGSFNTAGYSLTASSLLSSNLYNRTISFGSSTVTLSTALTFTSTTNLTVNTETSTIIATPASGTTFTITSSGVSFYNLRLASLSTTGLYTLIITSNLTITNALSFTQVTADAIHRGFIRSDIVGTLRTITLSSVSGTLQDVDFRDIAITGAAGTITGTRLGDCGGNSGITFATPKTVYWNLAGAQNWTATAWCTSSDGGATLSAAAINNFPLVQDTAVFNTVGSVTGTITISLSHNISGINMSARTNTAYPMTLTTQAFTIYGSFIGGSGVTRTGTGTITFAGRGTQTITSAGRQFTQPITIDNFSGTVQLGDNLFTNSVMVLTSGTFSAGSYNVTCTTFTSNNSNSRTLNMGSGIWTLTSTGTLWQLATSTNMTLNAQTSNILLSDNTTTARTFAGGGLTYNKLTIGGLLGISTLTISGNNTFSELACLKTVSSTISFASFSVQTIGILSSSGYYKNVLSLLGNGVTTPVFLTVGTCLANNLLVNFVRSTNSILNLGNLSSGYGNLNVIFSETNLLLNRLTAAGDLQVSGILDDSTNPYIEIDGISKITYAPEFDDYTSTGGIERKIYSNSYVVDGIFDEVTLNPFSISLNGINQYLSVPANSAFAFGTGEFTIEGWFYFNSFTGNPVLIDQYPAATISQGNWQIWVNTSGTFSFNYDGSTAVASSTTMALNTWYHIAACRIGTWTNNLGIFLNGVRVGTATYIGGVGRSDTTLWIGAQHSGGPTAYPNCYVSNLRILKGVGLYPWNPPTRALANVYETSLLTAQSATIVDNSPSALTITNTNGVSVSSSVVPFANTYSYSFNGTNQYLALPINTFNPNNNSFTIEMWLHPTAYPGGTNTAQLFNCSNATVGSFGGFNLSFYGSGQIRLDVRPNTGGTNVQTTTTSTIPLNAWTHVALSVNNGAATIFLNGVNSATSTIVVMDRTQTFCSIGYLNNGYTTSQSYYTGYISNFRIIKNIGLYVTNFSPIGPLGTLSGSTASTLSTSLLTAQAATIIDSSSYAVTITNNNSVTAGNTTIPFAGTYSYLFNGTNQYLSLPTSVFLPSSNTFTIEMWLYPTAYPGSTNIAQLFNCSNATVDNFGGFNFSFYGSGQIRLDVRSYTGGFNAQTITTSTISLNTWTHVAVSVNDGFAIIFINGVNAASVYINALDGTQTFCSIGYLNNGYTTSQSYYTGYISNFRITKNGGLYSTNFTVPTVPLTSNFATLTSSTTSLLTGQNVDIVDNGLGNSGAPFTITNNNIAITKSLTPFR